MNGLLLIGIGAVGGVGALARFLLDGFISTRVGGALPFGTLAVNVSGALLLGFAVGLALKGDALVMIGTGALGSYTTFSTWMLETHRLAEDGQGKAAGLNIAVSLAAGIVAIWLGRAIGQAL